MIEIISKSPEETKKIAIDLIKEIMVWIIQKHALIIAMEGSLGSGKTVFIQGFARGLGIRESVLSPTFLILKEFSIRSRSRFHYTNFYHIDAYRLKHQKELLELGFDELVKNPKNIIAIEWADKIKKILPKDILKIKFVNLGKNKRKIIIS